MYIPKSPFLIRVRWDELRSIIKKAVQSGIVKSQATPLADRTSSMAESIEQEIMEAVRSAVMSTVFHFEYEPEEDKTEKE